MSVSKKQMKDIQDRLENAQAAVADAARGVSDNAYMPESEYAEYRVPRGEMKALRDALKEWKAASEAFLKSVTS